jgi:hypothetical protein
MSVFPIHVAFQQVYLFYLAGKYDGMFYVEYILHYLWPDLIVASTGLLPR